MLTFLFERHSFYNNSNRMKRASFIVTLKILVSGIMSTLTQINNLDMASRMFSTFLNKTLLLCSSMLFCKC